jgi:hypothetical protein
MDVAEVYLRQTTGDDRILSEIVRLIAACSDEITAKQILLSDLPKAEIEEGHDDQDSAQSSLARRWP